MDLFQVQNMIDPTEYVICRETILKAEIIESCSAATWCRIVVSSLYLSFQTAESPAATGTLSTLYVTNIIALKKGPMVSAALELTALEIPDVKLIRPKRSGDARGFFSEVYNRRVFTAHGIHIDFVQDNHSRSEKRGTVRGLHFQVPPFAQDKLVRVVRGRILDVAVDIRKGLPTCGRHVAVELSADNWWQLLVPIGFAHGFITLEPDTEVLYKVSNYYSAEHDKGLFWNDPVLKIAWPVQENEAILSEKDLKQPCLAALGSPFE